RCRGGSSPPAGGVRTGSPRALGAANATATRAPLAVVRDPGPRPRSDRRPTRPRLPAPPFEESEGRLAPSSSLQRNDLLLRFDGGLKRVPRQACALHANRELADAGEDRQLAQRRGVDRVSWSARHHAMELLEELMGLRLGLAFDGVRHEGGGGLR